MRLNVHANVKLLIFLPILLIPSMWSESSRAMVQNMSIANHESFDTVAPKSARDHAINGTSSFHVDQFLGSGRDSTFIITSLLCCMCISLWVTVLMIRL